MQPFKNHTSIAALLNRANVDTDQIIAKQFLKKIERTGFGIHLFHDWRYHSDGSDNLSFELNNPHFANAKILVTGANFGCGSSREHAVWAIKDYGFNTIIAPSFSDIFYTNCFKNSILPIRVNQEQSDRLMQEIATNPGVAFTVDLELQMVTSAAGYEVCFDIDDFHKNNLLKGLDDIAVSLLQVDKITAFEKRQKQAMPWLWPA